MKRIVDFIPNLPKKPYRNDKPEGLVFHTTGIMNIRNDSVERNRNVFTTAYVEKSKSFVHGFVDDLAYWQSADYDYSAWGAGYVANQRYIHIELCDTKDPIKFKKAYDNSIDIIVEILKKYNLKPFRKNTLWTHYEVTHTLGSTTHTDPVPLFNYHKVTIDQFYKDVENAYYNKAVACISIDKIMWGKTELKKGQIGKVTILQRINLWQDSPHESDKLQMVRVLNPDEEYRVYGYREDHGGQYNVGGGMWITKIDGFIKYETPSKAMLAPLAKRLEEKGKL